MGRLLLICLGGAIGTGARFGLATWVAQTFGGDFPRGTILINAVGSFLIALVMHVSVTTAAVPPMARLFLTTGVMGGFTTYSSFNYETLSFFEQGAWFLGSLNLVLTVAGCLVAGILGLLAGRVLAGV